MSLSFDEAKRQFALREELRKQGKTLLADAMYELQEQHGVLPTNIEEKYGLDLGASFLRSGEPEKLSSLERVGQNPGTPRNAADRLSLFQVLLNRLVEARIPQAPLRMAAEAPEMVERDRPLASIPALFDRPDRSAEEGEVDVFSVPRLSPEGVLSIIVRIPEKFCAPGKPVEVDLVAAPTGTPVGEPVQVALGEPKSLSFDLPADLQEAWRGIAMLQLEELPLRFVVRGLAPQKPEEPDITADGLLPKARFRLLNELRFSLDEVESALSTCTPRRAQWESDELTGIGPGSACETALEKPHAREVGSPAVIVDRRRVPEEA